MKKDIDILKIFDSVDRAVRCIYALHGLLDTLEERHFYLLLPAARKEAGFADEKEGSFWWMQDHYAPVSSIVMGANCLAESLEKILVDLEGSLPPRYEEKGGDTE
ncbi:MAG: hypothetical protein ACI3VS_00555 [Evtepia sp.]